jgi:hypothetical protein
MSVLSAVPSLYTKKGALRKPRGGRNRVCQGKVKKMCAIAGRSMEAPVLHMADRVDLSHTDVVTQVRVIVYYRLGPLVTQVHYADPCVYSHGQLWGG